MVVRQDDVEVGAVEHVAERLHRVAADADEPHLPLLLQLPQGGDRLLDNLRHVDELDVVAEADVEMLHAHPVQADVDALDHPPGRKVEVGPVVAAELRPQDVASRGTSRSATPSSTSDIPRP